MSLNFAEFPMGQLLRTNIQSSPLLSGAYNVMGDPGKGMLVTHFDQWYKIGLHRIMFSPVAFLTPPTCNLPWVLLFLPSLLLL